MIIVQAEDYGSITVLIDGGSGKTFKKGDTMTIRWTNALTYQVNINLSDNNDNHYDLPYYYYINATREFQCLLNKLKVHFLR